jgi:hypothetical protein
VDAEVLEVAVLEVAVLEVEEAAVVAEAIAYPEIFQGVLPVLL